ncbi:hypothetical protein GCM10009844_05530 [Nocardioides koreensis]|uniref:Ig-like domain repeat protein n=1 Tax=Nocardioides koreensis TaxID=433651 RepID=A0ABP5KVB0_9ACTN
MKKLFAGLVATIMMVGLVSGLSAGSAVAKSRYPDSVATGVNIKVANKVKKGHSVRIGVKVTAAGNGGPKNGSVSIRVHRRAGGYHWVDGRDYDGGWVYFRTSKFNKVGKYFVRARYDRPGANSPWMDSNNQDSFKVVR